MCRVHQYHPRHTAVCVRASQTLPGLIVPWHDTNAHTCMSRFITGCEVIPTFDVTVQRVRAAVDPLRVESVQVRIA